MNKVYGIKSISIGSFDQENQSILSEIPIKDISKPFESSFTILDVNPKIMRQLFGNNWNKTRTKNIYTKVRGEKFARPFVIKYTLPIDFPKNATERIKNGLKKHFNR